MFYLGLVTMKEMSPKQWAKAAGTQSPAGGMESPVADPVLALRVSRGRALPSLGLASDPMGIFSCPSWFGKTLTMGLFLGASLSLSSLVKASVLRSKDQSKAQVLCHPVKTA